MGETWGEKGQKESGWFGPSYWACCSPAHRESPRKYSTRRNSKPGPLLCWRFSRPITEASAASHTHAPPEPPFSLGGVSLRRAGSSGSSLTARGVGTWRGGGQEKTEDEGRGAARPLGQRRGERPPQLTLHGRNLLGILVGTSLECSFWAVAGGGASSVGDRPWTPRTRRRPRGGHRLRRRLHV